MKMTEDWHQFSKEESIIQQTTKAASGYDKNKTTDIFKDRRLEDSYSLYKKHLKHSEERNRKISHTLMYEKFPKTKNCIIKCSMFKKFRFSNYSSSSRL